MPRLGRELAGAQAGRQALGEIGHALFAMGGDQFAQRGGQGGMREAIAFYPRQNSFREGLGDIDQGRAVLFRACFVESGGMKWRVMPRTLVKRAGRREAALAKGLTETVQLAQGLP